MLKIEMLFQHILANVREVAAYYKADFFREGGTLLPYPLNRKSFCQKKERKFEIVVIKWPKEG